MSKRTKRAKRERELDKLAAAKMARLMRGEQQERYVITFRFEVDATLAHRVDSVRSWVRKWERQTAGAKVTNCGEGFSYG